MLGALRLLSTCVGVLLAVGSFVGLSFADFIVFSFAVL